MGAGDSSRVCCFPRCVQILGESFIPQESGARKIKSSEMHGNGPMPFVY